MSKEIFKTEINAPKEKVWKILWDDETYRKWTSAFAEGSYMESDWKIGGRTLFLGGEGNGMVSTIDQLKENEIMSFKHLGMIKDGKEDLESEEVKQWAGLLETYILESSENKTQLSVEMDLADDYKDYFLEAFPKALKVVKDLSEE
ncbi:MAG: SRPBCC domain-containing protein [Ignavibacteriae bacterium]|nr:SRPBCC domain-containing protein [Ignavibacteriota bacterium]MCB9208547.1 SRPBCC domain-containing protein [Ignavibacteriales bacterium]MCB9258344.1 SRPBCC domain-containing protein [Ignavibacteriales bacterium]